MFENLVFLNKIQILEGFTSGKTIKIVQTLIENTISNVNRMQFKKNVLHFLHNITDKFNLSVSCSFLKLTPFNAIFYFFTRWKPLVLTFSGRVEMRKWRENHFRPMLLFYTQQKIIKSRDGLRWFYEKSKKHSIKTTRRCFNF